MKCDRCGKAIKENEEQECLNLYVGEEVPDLFCKLCPGCQEDLKLFMGLHKRAEGLSDEYGSKVFIVTADGTGGILICDILPAENEDEAWEMVMETACQAKSNDFSCERMEEVELEDIRPS